MTAAERRGPDARERIDAAYYDRSTYFDVDTEHLTDLSEPVSTLPGGQGARGLRSASGRACGGPRLWLGHVRVGRSPRE